MESCSSLTRRANETKSKIKLRQKVIFASTALPAKSKNIQTTTKEKKLKAPKICICLIT